jgi:hypothetical protein
MLMARLLLETPCLECADIQRLHSATIECSKVNIGDGSLDSPSSLVHAGTTGACRSFKEP